MIISAFTCLSKFFAKWSKIKFLMGLLIVLMIINIGLSSYLYLSFVGSVNDPNWSTTCTTSPIYFMTPFSFQDSSGVTTTCGFPMGLTASRLSIDCLATLMLIISFFSSPLQHIALIIWTSFALFYFSIFSLDIYSSNNGSTACLSNFSGTSLNSQLSGTISCNNGNFSVLGIIDLVMSGIFFLLYGAWSLCPDLYATTKKKTTKK